jgi:hypothetical protein
MGWIMCKAKGLVAGALFLALVLMPGISLACGAKPETPPPPPTSLEATVSDNYTIYTDESGLFSISYPSDWSLSLAFLASLGQDTKPAISNLQSGLPVEKATVLFTAGRRTATGYEPNTNIVVEPPPEEISTLDGMVEAEVQIAQKGFPDYQEFSRTKTTVDGREAIILDWEGTPQTGKKLHFLQMFTLVDKAVWSVTCTALPDDFGQWQNVFQTIVQSLRISK